MDSDEENDINEPQKKQPFIQSWSPETRREYIHKNLTGIGLKINIIGGILMLCIFLGMLIGAKLGYLK